jgi:alkylated DNA repair dioxygenase AlkB
VRLDQPGFLTPGRFQDWLSSKDPGETVGIAEQSHACPLACFMRAVDAHDWVISGDEAYRESVVTSLHAESMTGELTRHNVLPWVSDFIQAIDGTDEYPAVGPVTSEQALRILEQCCEVAPDAVTS